MEFETKGRSFCNKIRRTGVAKIVSTLRPSSSSREKIKELFMAGADVFRLNFSHGIHEEHTQYNEDILIDRKV